MPQRIEVPGMGMVEFPDGMNDADISSAIRRSMTASQAQSQASPETPGMAETALIAAGRGTDKLVQGVRQLWNTATGDKATLDKMAAEQANNDRAYRPLQQAHPFITSAAEMAPSLAASFVAGPTVLGAAAANGIPSLLSYGTAEERYRRGVTDAAMGGAGAVAGKALARVLKPAGVGAEVADDAAMQAAQRLGYRPLPSQLANNPGLASVENYFLRTPGSSGTMQAAATANQSALNRAGARAMGQSGDVLDEGVFGAAKRTLGSEFERLGEVTKPQLGDDFINALAKIESQNGARGPFANKQVSSLVDKGLDLAAKGDLDGKAYKEIRTELANQAQSAFRAGDASTGQAYKSVVEALDKSAKASLSEADQKAWDVARQQWQAYKTLSKSNVAEAGNVSAARVAAAVRSKSDALRTGALQGDLADIARIGEAFKGVGNPNSGQLGQMTTVMSASGLPIMLGNKIGAAAYMSPAGQRYFSRGLLDVGETGQGLLSRGGGLLGTIEGRRLLGME